MAVEQIGNDYVVEWSIDVVAESPQAAAAQAWELLRAPHSTANVFDVIPADGSGEAVRVDLQELIEEEATNADNP